MTLPSYRILTAPQNSRCCGRRNGEGRCIVPMVDPTLGGALTLLPRNSDIKILQQIKDQQGRLLILQIERDGEGFTLANVYAPTQDHVQEQMELIDLLEQNIIDLNPSNIILGGDFNLCTDPSLDKASLHSPSPLVEDTRYSSRIKAMKDSLHLFNVWRKLNPSKRQYSFRRGLSASQLDYWFTSEHMLDSYTSSTIVPYPLSDHSSIVIKVGDLPSKKGPGLWRLDNALIHRDDFRDAIKLILQEETSNQEFTDNGVHWDWIKYRVKTIRITMYNVTPE